MRMKTLVALYFGILEFDDVTCIRSIVKNNFSGIDKSQGQDLEHHSLYPLFSLNTRHTALLTRITPCL